MEAIVLAGGLGTRLRSVISEIPKPMAPIGKKPFLEYILKYLSNNGIKKVILSVGYKWDIIKDYFGDKYNDIDLLYSVEEYPLGTGGAIKQAIETTIDSEKVFIVNGDTFFNIDLNKLILKYQKSDTLLSLSLKKMTNFDRYGSVEIDENGFIKGFFEKKYQKEGYINGGIYLVSSDIFNNFELPEKFSFEEFIQKEYKKLNANAEIFDDYFIDIGIPEDYEKAQKELKYYI